MDIKDLPDGKIICEIWTRPYDGKKFVIGEFYLVNGKKLDICAPTLQELNDQISVFLETTV